MGIILPVPICFHPDTMVKKSNGQLVKVIELTEGDDIMTLENMEVCPTNVTNATVIHGSFDALKFVLEDGKNITVTPLHLMLILKNGEMSPLQAKDLQVHDIMPLEGRKLSKIVDIEHVKIATKVNIETASGAFYANGIFVTGMCEKSPSLEGKNANTLLMEYKSSHMLTA